MWLNEHFASFYSNRPGYETAHPWGCNASAGLRWEYLPACGFAQGDLLGLYDVIPRLRREPGFFSSTVRRFRDDYDTLSGRLTLENVLTPRLRAEQELQFTNTTDRQLRCSVQSSLNCALAEHWVLRLALAGTEEPPRFEAWSAEVNRRA